MLPSRGGGLEVERTIVNSEINHFSILFYSTLESSFDHPFAAYSYSSYGQVLSTIEFSSSYLPKLAEYISGIVKAGSRLESCH